MDERGGGGGGGGGGGMVIAINTTYCKLAGKGLQ